MNEENKMESENMQSSEEVKTGGMNWLYIVVALVLLLGAGYYFMNQKTKVATKDVTRTTEQPVIGENVNETVVEETGTVETAEENEDGTQSLTVEGGMFYFKPNKIIVKKDQPVEITFKNVEGMHDFVIDELNVKSETIAAGKTTTVEFTPTKVGEFQFYCSIADHKAKGMVGTLIVE